MIIGVFLINKRNKNFYLHFKSNSINNENSSNYLKHGFINFLDEKVNGWWQVKD